MNFIFKWLETWFNMYRAASSTAKPNFKQGFQVNGTDYTANELNLALGEGDSGAIVTGITAGTTQTQAGATALTGRYNNVTTVGTAGDGVKLPTASAGLKVTVRNSGANTLKCYPATSDNLNALAVNLSVDIPALSETTFTAIDATTWYSEPTALYLSSPTTLTGGLQIKAAASAGNTTTLITNASQAAARTYTIPDAGASASFVMTEGAQTINGTKTYGGQAQWGSGTGISSTQVYVGGSDGIAGDFKIYPGTSAKGYIVIQAIANTGDTALTIANAAQAGARTYTIPDNFAASAFGMVKQVTDAGPMTATGGAFGSLAYNTSDSKVYFCTVAHATAATWVALN